MPSDAGAGAAHLADVLARAAGAPPPTPAALGDLRGLAPHLPAPPPPRGGPRAPPAPHGGCASHGLGVPPRRGLGAGRSRRSVPCRRAGSGPLRDSGAHSLATAPTVPRRRRRPRSVPRAPARPAAADGPGAALPCPPGPRGPVTAPRSRRASRRQRAAGSRRRRRAGRVVHGRFPRRQEQRGAGDGSAGRRPAPEELAPADATLVEWPW